MFEFFKSLLTSQNTSTYNTSKNKKYEESKNHRILIDNRLIEQGEYIESEILKIFGNNLPLFHRVILPLLTFFSELNVGAFEMSNILKESYIDRDVKPFAIHTNDIFQKSKKNIAASLSYKDSTSNAISKNLISEELTSNLLKLSYIQEEIVIQLKNSLKEDLSNYNITDIINEFFKEQLRICLIKIFAYESYIKEVDKNIELTKILTNALYKFQGIDLISEQTYDLFIEYMNISSYSFPQRNYKEFINIYISTKTACNEFYSNDELNLDLDINSMSLPEIIEAVTTSQMYQSFDTKKLVISLLYNKITNYNNLSMLLKDIKNVQNYISKIKKAKTKYDLLNNTYNTKQITISDIDLMNGIEFEKFLCKLLTKMNFTCENTKASGDQGIDIIAIKDNIKIAIQAKCYNQPVGNHAVMEAIAGAKYYNAEQCMVITNSTFTKSAKELAIASGVVLWDRRILIEKLKEY